MVRACSTTALASAFALTMAGSAFARDPVRAWGITTFGYPGMIDMPVANSREDGELSFTLSHFHDQTRVSGTFQFSDRLSATFRYARLNNVRRDPDSIQIDPERYDRSFSLHFRFMDEGDYLPAMAIGLNDIMGTGIYSGEYIVASKTLTPDLRATLGIGWGRLGGVGGFSNPLAIFGNGFRTRPNQAGGEGGSFQADTWFRGDAAFFGGVEWAVNDRLRLIAEYSSDDYAREDGAAFDRRSPLNLGLSWAVNERTSLAANYLYGSEIGLQLTYALNPKHSPQGSGRDPAPPAIPARDTLAARSWGDVDAAAFPERAARALELEGLQLDGIVAKGQVLQVQIRNLRYGRHAQAAGRAARVLSRIAPAEVARFEITLAERGMPVSRLSLNRSDLERYESDPVAPDLMRVATVITDNPLSLPVPEGSYPRLKYALAPYLAPGFFDPEAPLRADAGIALTGSYEPAPGLIFSGSVRQKLLGNLDSSDRISDSVLPHVRSDASLYDRNDGPVLQSLTAAWYFRPGKDLFGRVTAGYLERMFGGISAEILWKPGNSALALGAELNHVRQRDFDMGFGFQDYTTTTGHLSAWYQFGNGYDMQLDVGRYLAGDSGATLTLSREFGNGWKVGAFATKTNISASEFGEGSFDKGILLTIPLAWALGTPSRTEIDMTLRPLLRDGGQRLSVDGRLYETVRGLQPSEMDGSWGRFWK